MDKGLENESVILLVRNQASAAHESEKAKGKIRTGIHSGGGDEGVESERGEGGGGGEGESELEAAVAGEGMDED